MPVFSLGLLLISPLLIAAVHAALLRTAWGQSVPRQRLTIQCAVVTSGLLSLFICTNVQSFIFSLTITLGLGHVYFHVFNMSETARRIRILISLVQGLPTSKLEGAYSSDGIIKVRLERLRSMGQISEVNGVYQTNPSLLLKIARAMKTFERLLFPNRV